MTESETTTLHIRVGERERLHRDAGERIRAAERGEDIDGVGDRHVLNIEDPTDLDRVVSSTTLALLRAIAEHEPTSMRETADLVGRDIKDVHANLTELAALNVIELEAEGASKRPVVQFDEIEVDIPLAGDSEGDTESTAA